MSPGPLRKAAAAGCPLPLCSPLCPHLNHLFPPPPQVTGIDAQLHVAAGCWCWEDVPQKTGSFGCSPLPEEWGWPLPMGQTLALAFPARMVGAGNEPGVQGSGCRCPGGAGGRLEPSSPVPLAGTKPLHPCTEGGRHVRGARGFSLTPWQSLFTPRAQFLGSSPALWGRGANTMVKPLKKHFKIKDPPAEWEFHPAPLQEGGFNPPPVSRYEPAGTPQGRKPFVAAALHLLQVNEPRAEPGLEGRDAAAAEPKKQLPPPPQPGQEGLELAREGGHHLFLLNVTRKPIQLFFFFRS